MIIDLNLGGGLMEIGVIGLGNMGAAIASNLLAAGFEVDSL